MQSSNFYILHDEKIAGIYAVISESLESPKPLDEARAFDASIKLKTSNKCVNITGVLL